MTRVLFVGHSAALSGAELFLAGMLERVATIEPVVLLLEDGPLRQRLEASGIRVVVLPLPSAVASVTADDRADAATGGRAALARSVAGFARRLRATIRAERPDVVYTNSAKAHVLAIPAARSLRIPAVLHVHDMWTRESFSAANLAVLRIVAAGARTLVANSAGTRATLGARARGRSVVVHCPTEIPADPAVLRATPDPLSVAVVGRVADWKGQDLAVRAVDLLRRRGVPAELHVYGAAAFGKDADYLAEVEALVRARDLAGVVHLHGHVDDVPAAMRRHDVVAHTSLRPEPMGQVVVEAMAAGMPVVAARAGGPLELVDDEVTGLLYAMGDEVALADALERLHRDADLRTRLGAAAHGGARRFSYEEIVPRWEAVIRAAARP